jgi:iron-sulfur cluster repair protein YtfE (RIC family)
MYAIEESNNENFNANLAALRRFMRSYPHQQDIEKMISILQGINNRKHSTSNDAQSLVLLCKKISALHHEEFEILPEIQKELEELKIEN